MKVELCLLMAGVLGGGGASFAEVVVDDEVPAGNIIVLKQSEGKVELRQDQRDTRGVKWFYWGFRVTGAAGKTITFEFPDGEPDGGPVGVRGPVVTKDRCGTFAFPLDGKCDKRSFTYVFGADEDETWFYECYPYVAADEGMLILKCNAIHTFFMSFAIDAIFLDKNDKIVKTVCNIRPGRLWVWGGFRASKVLEVRSTL